MEANLFGCRLPRVTMPFEVLAQHDGQLIDPAADAEVIGAGDMAQFVLASLYNRDLGAEGVDIGADIGAELSVLGPLSINLAGQRSQERFHFVIGHDGLTRAGGHAPENWIMTRIAPVEKPVNAALLIFLCITAGRTLDEVRTLAEDG
jgi:hypothetical protein